ncbi:MAG: zinc ribbon domain-containing protein [Candidatus Aminicenantes bacterium]|nr:zinc ribbon domain-containing protein [Candidatus Aminicenantes bacterium]
MPIYEYRCLACKRKSSFLFLHPGRTPELVCPHCGGRELEKLVSRVAVLRSEEGRLERLADAAETAGVDENDPRSVARWMKKMGREMGDEMGEDFDRSLEEAMANGTAGESGGAADEESLGPGSGEDMPPDPPPEED